MASMWRKTLAYLGLVEDYDDEYADLPEDEQVAARPQQRARVGANAAPEPAPRPEPSNVRRIPSATSRPVEAAPAAPIRPAVGAKVHVTNPSTFNDVEEVGDRFRNGVPVIMNLAGASENVAKRLLDFASGLIFGLDGRIERVGDRVFLLTPMGVDVSTEERARLEQRGFFNQA